MGLGKSASSRLDAEPVLPYAEGARRDGRNDGASKLRRASDVTGYNARSSDVLYEDREHIDETKGRQRRRVCVQIGRSYSGKKSADSVRVAVRQELRSGKTSELKAQSSNQMWDEHQVTKDRRGWTAEDWSSRKIR